MDNMIELNSKQYERFINLPLVKDTYQYFVSRMKPVTELAAPELAERRWIQFAGILYVEKIDVEET